MKTIDERRFSFIPQKKWNKLTKEERSVLGSYKSYYGHYIRTEEKIEGLLNEIYKLKIRKILTLLG